MSKLVETAPKNACFSETFKPQTLPRHAALTINTLCGWGRGAQTTLITFNPWSRSGRGLPSSRLPFSQGACSEGLPEHLSFSNEPCLHSKQKTKPSALNYGSTTRPPSFVPGPFPLSVPPDNEHSSENLQSWKATFECAGLRYKTQRRQNNKLGGLRC